MKRKGKGNKSRDAGKENFWRQMIARQKDSGKTQKKFCHDEDLNLHNFQSWQQVIKSRDNFKRRQMKNIDTESDALEPFVRVLVSGEPEQHPTEVIKNGFADPIAEIEYLNIKLRILRGVDPASLHAILSVVQERFS